MFGLEIFLFSLTAIVFVLVAAAVAIYWYVCHFSSKLLAEIQEWQFRPDAFPEVAQDSVPFHLTRRSLTLVREKGEESSQCTPKAKGKERSAYSSEYDDYCADESSGDSSSGKKSQVKKPRVRRSSSRYGVTDSNSSDGDSPSPERQNLSATQTQQQEMVINGSLEGKPVSYSGDEKRKSSDSDVQQPVEDRSPHDDRVSYEYTFKDPWKSPEVLQVKSEVCKLKEEHLKLKKENGDLKNELATKDQRFKSVLNRLLKEKDTENYRLKEDIEILKEKLNKTRQVNEQIEELKRQLDAALNRSEEEDRRAEDVEFNENDFQDVRHRSLSQTL